jgi:predicted ferric reductase
MKVRLADVEQSGRSPVRSVLTVFLVAAVLTLLIAGQIYRLQASGRSAAAIAMAADMDMRDTGKYWSFPILQASGLVALAFAYVAALLGLWQAIGKSAHLQYARIERLHRHVSWVVVTLILIHVLATTLDAMGDNWRTVLIPGTWATQGWPAAVTGYNTGIAATYLLLGVAPTYYLRQMIGSSRWRIVHRAVLIFYVLSIWHAMTLGLDLAYYSWMRPLIWLLQLPLLALLMIRLHRLAWAESAGTRSANLAVRITCSTLFVVCAMVAIGLLLLVLTGRAGFIATV